MDEKSSAEHEAEDVSSDTCSFAEWGSIIAEVQDCLPTIDSDSEVSTMTEDSDVEVSVFQRKVATIDASDSDSSERNFPTSLPMRKKWPEPSDKQETSTLNSEGYASATSSSPTSVTSSATSKSTSADDKSSGHFSATGKSTEAKSDSTSLLFQRLHSHLGENVHSASNDKDDLHLTDLDLELPIYEDEGAPLYDAGKLKDLSPPPLDMRHDSSQTPISRESDKHPTAERTRADSPLGEQAAGGVAGKAPVLSLKGLEGFDLDELLDDVCEFDYSRFTDPLSPQETDEGNESSETLGTELMEQLIGLSKTQRGMEDIGTLRERGREKPDTGHAGHFLGRGQWSEDPGGKEKVKEEILEKAETEEINEKKINAAHMTTPTTTSCGVSANFPKASSELSLSEPTTIFLDLRPTVGKDESRKKKFKTNDEKKNANEIVGPRVSRFPPLDSISESSKQIKVMERVQSLNKIKTMTRTDTESSESDSEENDDDYEQWQIMRSRIKARSILSAAASPKSRSSKENRYPNSSSNFGLDDDLDLKLDHVGMTVLVDDHPIANEVKVESAVANNNSGQTTRSFGENIPGIEHIDDEFGMKPQEKLVNGHATDTEIQAFEKEKPLVNGIGEHDALEDNKEGIYAKQRLKNETPKKKPARTKKVPEKSALRSEKDTSKADKGKITVSFAEEPKKDDSDTTNVYRAKNLQTMSKIETKEAEIPPEPSNLSISPSVSSTTCSVQTEEQYDTKKMPEVKLHEVVNNLLGAGSEIADLLKDTDAVKKYGHTIVTDEILQRQEKLAKDNFEYAKLLSLSSKMQKGGHIPRVTKLKLKNILEKESSNETSVLYDMDASFDIPISSTPPELDTQRTQMVLLTINMSSTGCIVTHRSSGGHKGTPVDANIGFSITFPMLLSWLLALVPEDLTKLQQARMDDAFALEIDPELVPELTNGKDSPNIPLSVDVPFNVVSLHQTWQEDSQSLALQAIVIPNFYYRPETKRGRKKARKEDAFLQVVWHFLQSNRIQDVCPWHDRPESPIHYSLTEMIVTCATKPLSTYVAASNDSVLIEKALKNKPGMFWKTVNPDDQSTGLSQNSEYNKLQTTTCILQREAFLYPIAVMDIAIRLQTSCFDLAGLRLAYVTRRFLNDNTLYNCMSSKLDPEEKVPCVVMAIRGRSAIVRWSKIVGPRDPILARMSERMSLNSTYGEQLSIKRGDETLPTDVNMFCYPRSENRALHQLCIWFGGRVDIESQPFLTLLDPEKAPLVDPKVEKVTNGRGNGKNGKNKSRNNSTSTSSISTPNTIDKLKSATSYLVACCRTHLYLVVSPRLPTQFISDVLHTVTQQGFLVQGVRRFRLTEKKAAALSISSRYYPCFCPQVTADMPVDVDYFEDIWWIMPATVFLLSRENAHAHQAGLVHALQTEIMVNLSPPDEEGHVKVITYQCFHTTPYTDAVEHAVGSLTKVPDVELSTGSSPRTFYSNPEMEQVLVLSLLGDRAIDECGDVLRRILHGEFQYSPQEFKTTGRFLPQSIIDDETEVECFRGFELLGLKWLPSLTSMQAKELTPFEVGTPAWHESLPLLQSSPVVLCVLRRVNAFEVLEDVLRIPHYSYSTSETILKSEEFTRIMSSTPEIAYRQMKIFFSDKELFPDNQSRPLLKYLPPPTRVHQYRLRKNVLVEGVELSAGGDQQNGQANSTGGARSEGSKRSSTKKKKKQNGKNKDSNNNNSSNGSGNNAAFALPEESIFTSMVSCQQPLTSIIVIKPDAFPRHFIKIFRQLHYEGFSVVALKVLKMTEDEALEIMPPFLKEMQGEIQVYLDHMTSDLSLIACVQRDNAVRHLCHLAGPYDPCVARRKCYLPDDCSTPTRATWRALFGIDNMSNGIHVSDSYLSACQELKRFFPEGICCQETLELRMEMVPAPGEDSYMCLDKMKGREVKILSDFRQSNSASSLSVTYMPRKPVFVVLTPPLFHSPNSNRSRLSRHPLTQRPVGTVHGTVPPYVEILETLLVQGFEICAARMAWMRQHQAEQLLQILGCLSEDGSHDMNMVVSLTRGPSLLLVMQRENALVLFDSILGSTKTTGDSLFHKYSSHILRSQNTEQTKVATRYAFPRIPYQGSVITLSHKRAQEWKETSVGDGV